MTIAELEEQIIEKLILTPTQGLRQVKTQNVKECDFTYYKQEFIWLNNYFGTTLTITKEQFLDVFPAFICNKIPQELSYTTKLLREFRNSEEVGRLISGLDYTLEGYLDNFIANLNKVKRAGTEATILNYADYGDRDALNNTRSLSSAVTLGIPELDRALGGLSSGQSIMFVAPPKTAKTWFLVTRVRMFLEQQQKVLMITKEISAKRLRDRVDAVLLDTHYQRARLGQLSEEELLTRANKFREFLVTHPNLDLHIEEDHTQDITVIDSYIAEYKPTIVLVDGAYLWAKSTDWKDMTAVTRYLADISSRRNIILLYTWQANVVETTRMKASEIGLAKLGALADADAVIGLARSQEHRDMGIMSVNVLGSRESEMISTEISWGFNNKGYPVAGIVENILIDEISQETEGFILGES